MSLLTEEYPVGAQRAMGLNEGSPLAWKEQGILPLSADWENELGSLTNIAIGGYNLSNTKVDRVIGGVCIYKSNGEFAQLPLSFLWEILVVAMFAKKLKVEALILVPIMEEAHNYPMYKEKYLKLSSKIKRLVEQLSDFLGVEMLATHADKLFQGGVDQRDLYGLFQPYTTNQKLKLYPMGTFNEDQILKGYESYCLRYRYPNGAIEENDLVVDGIHLSKSVITGIEKQAKFIPTLPIPSFDSSENCLLVDSKHVPAIYDEISFESIKELDGIIVEILGYQFKDILEFVKTI
ncbi:hypothetical protein [Mesobacillus selenatarsenatis]|uniref:Uncharacterized protein n=1 Tax=Mesobacillus selenatarsenatis (strain DSM 18680 / JCM 14380 / FERM P-15431 / SF-1) TaxID=1321606 RepID=A0A0A8WYR1_MESS1|nr:hypothetical protein [Mesobacillus selenatarsenatis]GAM12845.1 hypothetical protein SAMD00020551_0980 [Mesobacillus selenatarsenatis SF-1]